MVFRLFYSLWLVNLATILRYWKIAIFDKADYIEIEPEVGLLTLKYPITDKHSDLHTSSRWKIDIENIETPNLGKPKSLKLCVVTALIVCGYTCFTLQIVDFFENRDYFLTLLQNLLIEFKWWSPIYQCLLYQTMMPNYCLPTETLERFIQCPICFETVPLKLPPCQHHICQACLGECVRILMWSRMATVIS